MRSRVSPAALLWSRRAVRFACATVLVALGVTAWLMRTPYRAAEAVASAWAADHLLTAPVFAYPAEALIFVGRPVQLAFEITPECSSLVVALTFLFGSATLAVVAPRFRMRRILTALAVAGALALGINVLRVVIIVVASSQWGHGIGYGLSHESVGSTLTVFGVAFALLCYLWMLARDRTPAGVP
ncbi:MAG TPA: exosortase/archaeosortase family protein [Cryptosporangiaceae bacterium]|nr:exosortase/archaeosortase family protein [Cryptosporangiaceae bacterium]